MSARRAFMCGRGRHRFPGVCQGRAQHAKASNPNRAKSAKVRGAIQLAETSEITRTCLTATHPRHTLARARARSRRSSHGSEANALARGSRQSQTAVKNRFFHTRPSMPLAVVGRSCLTTRASCYPTNMGGDLSTT